MSCNKDNNYFKKKKLYIPGSGMVEIGLSGSNIPFWTSSSLLARTDIFLSSAANKCKAFG